jgi:hypothetical protein
VINKVSQLFATSKDTLSVACAQLIVGAFFFAMQSCEYSKTTSPSESTTTKLLTLLQNIRFFKKSELINHDHLDLASADIVSITFESQKNKTKFQTISLHKSAASLCPVSTWSSIIKRLRCYPSSSDTTKINTYQTSTGQLLSISSTQIRQKLRAAAAILGPKTLGFSVDKIGCHSLRSGSATAMYTTIQLIGHWKSDAFLRCIQEQVDCFTSNVSFKMTQAPSFYMIPDPETDITTQSRYTQNKPMPYISKLEQDPASLIQVFPALVS